MGLNPTDTSPKFDLISELAYSGQILNEKKAPGIHFLVPKSL